MRWVCSSGGAHQGLRLSRVGPSLLSSRALPPAPTAPRSPAARPARPAPSSLAPPSPRPVPSLRPRRCPRERPLGRRCPEGPPCRPHLGRDNTVGETDTKAGCTIQHKATQRNATQRNATLRNATQRNSTQYNTILYDTIHYIFSLMWQQHQKYSVQLYNVYRS